MNFLNLMLNKTEDEFVEKNIHSIVPYIKVVSILLGLIFIIGIVSNLVSIITILKQKKIKTINLLILNLALADIVYTLGIPLFVTNVFSQSWPFNLIGCQLFFLTDFIGMIVGVYTVAALSVERYIEVTDKKKRLEKISDRFKLMIGILYLVLVWLFAFLFSLPMILSIELHESINSANICDTSWNHLTLNIFFIIKFIFIFIIPFSIILISSIKLLIFLKKWKSLRRPADKETTVNILLRQTTKSHQETNGEMRLKKANNSIRIKSKTDIRKKAIHIVLSIVLLFIIQWTPLWIAELNKAITNDNNDNFEDIESVHKVQNIHLINVIITLISYTNSIANPLLYMFLTFSFRKLIKLKLRALFNFSF